VSKSVYTYFIPPKEFEPHKIVEPPKNVDPKKHLTPKKVDIKICCVAS
jgi:hypothetical protein